MCESDTHSVLSHVLISTDEPTQLLNPSPQRPVLKDCNHGKIRVKKKKREIENSISLYSLLSFLLFAINCIHFARLL